MTDFILTAPIVVDRRKGRPAPNRANILHRRFGRLTVIGDAGTAHKASRWHCRCDCGTVKTVSFNSLRGGTTKSCGCSRQTGKNSRPRYKSAHAPGSASKRNVLKHYKVAAKGRALSWELTDDEFFTLTQQPCVYCGILPHRIRQTSRNGAFVWNGLDRLDNTTGYTAANVVPCCSTCNHAKCDMTYTEFLAWIDRLVRHDRTVPVVPISGPVIDHTPIVPAQRTLTWNGKTQTIPQWAAETGICSNTIRTRFLSLGWTAEQTLSEPLRPGKPLHPPSFPRARLLTYQGKTQSMSAWARQQNMNFGALRCRLERGWSVERTLTTPIGPNYGERGRH